METSIAFRFKTITEESTWGAGEKQFLLTFKAVLASEDKDINIDNGE